MSIPDTEPVAGETCYELEPNLAQRLSYGLDMIGAPELAGLIATAGLAAVYEQLQRTRTMLGENVHAEMAIGLEIARLTDEARRWKRRWAGAHAQAQREHARADLLRYVVLQVMAEQPDIVERALAAAAWGNPYEHKVDRAGEHDAAAAARMGHAYRTETEFLRELLADQLLAASERQGAKAREQLLEAVEDLPAEDVSEEPNRCGRTTWLGQRQSGPCVLSPGHEADLDHMDTSGATWRRARAKRRTADAEGTVTDQ